MRVGTFQLCLRSHPTHTQRWFLPFQSNHHCHCRTPQTSSGMQSSSGCRLSPGCTLGAFQAGLGVQITFADKHTQRAGQCWCERGWHHCHSPVTLDTMAVSPLWALSCPAGLRGQGSGTAGAGDDPCGWMEPSPVSQPCHQLIFQTWHPGKAHSSISSAGISALPRAGHTEPWPRGVFTLSLDPSWNSNPSAPCHSPRRVPHSPALHTQWFPQLDYKVW